jgi:hypothetical protein
MDKQELIKFLKENLKLDYEKSGGSYGSHEFKEIKLILCGEEVSSIFIED